MRRHVERGVWAGDAGAGARGQRRALIRKRAVGAGDVSDLRLRQRRAEAAVAAQACHRGETRLLWPDGARFRIEPGRNAYAGGEEGQRVRTERREDVDYLRIDCR